MQVQNSQMQTHLSDSANRSDVSRKHIKLWILDSTQVPQSMRIPSRVMSKVPLLPD
jgi:hypothetical protein